MTSNSINREEIQYALEYDRLSNAVDSLQLEILSLKRELEIDEAMYKAKKNGRNRTETWEP